MVYIEQGRTFLDYLGGVDVVNAVLATNPDAGLLRNVEERDRLIEDLQDLKLASLAWHASIDPDDGSLRFYCD